MWECWSHCGQHLWRAGGLAKNKKVIWEGQEETISKALHHGSALLRWASHTDGLYITHSWNKSFPRQFGFGQCFTTREKQERIRHKLSTDSWKISPKHLKHRTKIQMVHHCSSSSFSSNGYKENSAALSFVGTPSLGRHNNLHPPYRAWPTTQVWFHQSWTYRTNESTMFTEQKWGIAYRSMGDQSEQLTQDGWGLPHRWVERGPPSFSFHSRYNRTPPKNRGSQKLWQTYIQKTKE